MNIKKKRKKKGQVCLRCGAECGTRAAEAVVIALKAAGKKGATIQDLVQVTGYASRNIRAVLHGELKGLFSSLKLSRYGAKEWFLSTQGEIVASWVA